MSITTFLIDLDDTIYPPSSGIWTLIGKRIDLFIRNHLQVEWSEIPTLRQNLFNKYGTTMRGLISIYHIDAEEYLKFVHDVPIEDLISPDPKLNSLLTAYSQLKVIFTNSDERHARRVLRAMKLEDIFENIIDIHQISPYCKPQPEAYGLALKVLRDSMPQDILVIDDSPPNLVTANSLGFHTALVGSKPTEPGIEYVIPSLHELRKIIPA